MPVRVSRVHDDGHALDHQSAQDVRAAHVPDTISVPDGQPLGTDQRLVATFDGQPWPAVHRGLSSLSFQAFGQQEVELRTVSLIAVGEPVARLGEGKIARL